MILRQVMRNERLHGGLRNPEVPDQNFAVVLQCGHRFYSEKERSGNVPCTICSAEEEQKKGSERLDLLAAAAFMAHLKASPQVYPRGFNKPFAELSDLDKEAFRAIVRAILPTVDATIGGKSPGQLVYETRWFGVGKPPKGVMPPLPWENVTPAMKARWERAALAVMGLDVDVSVTVKRKDEK